MGTASTIDLSGHRMDNWKWQHDYIERMGQREFFTYVTRVFLLLEDLKPGDVVKIPQMVEPENYDLFVKCGCYYITTDRTNTVEFNNEFTEIRRINICNTKRSDPPKGGANGK